MKIHAKKIILVTALILLFASNSFGQIHFEANAGFLIGLPRGEFGDNVEQTGLGFGLTAGYKLPMTPLTVGLDFGYILYGREKRHAPFSYTIPDLTVEVTNKNNIVLGHLLFRLQPNLGSFMPYFDSLIGLKYLFTDTAVKGEKNFEEIASSNNLSDVAFSYGIGGGMKFKLWEPGIDTLKDVKLFGVYLDLQVRYLFGSEAEYLKKGDITVSGTEVLYNINKSKTELLTMNIGISFMF
ncbi:hypothetical protein ACFL7D_03185 [candidate division KSB1 bacterium]